LSPVLPSESEPTSFTSMALWSGFEWGQLSPCGRSLV
jgi:hypothetical protein